MDFFRVGMFRFQLVEQTNRRLRIDGIGEVGHGFERVNIDRTVDVHTLATAIRLQLLLLAATNPTIRRDAVELDGSRRRNTPDRFYPAFYGVFRTPR